ncbi:MAG: CRISPR-associated exonuclease Cas4 [Clostridia bacterium]|nr:CRISPR-associated exonuclease Cas4 [Clostridia bacterium]
MGSMIGEHWPVNGTLVWYYTICHRQVWLMARQLTPDEDDDNVAIGRFIHEHSYRRDRHELAVGNIRIDLMQASRDEVLIAEIKKSSRFLESARLQLKYYLFVLKSLGLDFKGVLLVPEERKRELVTLEEEDLVEIERIIGEIRRIIDSPAPPPAVRTRWCRPCAYAEFCWA